MMTDKQIDTLGTKAAEAAMKGAADYIKAHGLRDGMDLDRVTVLIRVTAKAALPQALADAKDAMDANLYAVAQQTFMASMVLAGVQAVKDYQKEVELRNGPYAWTQK